jgi:ABC-type branched-subunit amino acid transport system substrate-binding protein
MRRCLIAAAAVLLVVSACTSGDSKEDVGSKGTEGGQGATSTTLDPEEVAQAPGVTADSVKVGVTYVDETALKAAGINFKTGEYKDSYQALVDQINAKGGINGRQIELAFAPINPVGTAPADAACLRLAQDEKVFVMVGFFLNDAVLCPIETQNVAVVGGTQTPERLERAKAPWFTTDPGS